LIDTGVQAGQNIYILFKPLLIIAATVALLWFVPGVGPLVYLLLALHAVRGPRETIEALTLLILVLLGNPLIKPSGSETLRWLVFFAGFGRLLWDMAFDPRRVQIPKSVVGALTCFVVWSSVVGFVVSPIPTVSLLKLTSFTIGVFTIIVCAYCTRDMATYWRSWFFTFFIFSVGISVLIFALGMGYWRTPEGFQGILNHPQVLGPVAAVIAAWMTGLYLVGGVQMRWPAFALMGASWVLVFLSGARTGLAAALFGILITAVLLVFSQVDREVFRSILKPRVIALVIALGGIMILYAPQIQGNIAQFLEKKRGRTGVTLEELEAKEILQESRGQLINRSMNNFLRSPWVGIGFGVPSNARGSQVHFNTVWGIPVGGGENEKGFMPSAMLEEVGVVGTVLALLFLAVISLTIARWGGGALNWMYWTSLLINGGASILFSVGGLGLFMWIIVAFCYAQAQTRKEQAANAHAVR